MRYLLVCHTHGESGIVQKNNKEKMEKDKENISTFLLISKGYMFGPLYEWVKILLLNGQTGRIHSISSKDSVHGLRTALKIEEEFS